MRPQPGEGLRELAADRPAAEHEEPRGQLIDIPHRLARESVDTVETLDARQDGRGAGRDDRLTEADALAVHLRLAGAEKVRRAERDAGAHGVESFGGVLRLDRADGGVHVPHDRGEVDGDLARPHTELGARACAGRRIGGGDERLGRNAAGPQAVPAHAVALDEQYVGAEARRSLGRDDSRCASPDHEQVDSGAGVSLSHGARVAPRPAPRVCSSAHDTLVSTRDCYADRS